MRQKILIVLGTIFLLSLFFSCKKMMTESPTTALAPVSVYGSKASLESAAIGLYSNLSHSSLWKGNFADPMVASSGFVYWGLNLSTNINYIPTFKQTWPSNNAYNYAAYQQIYVIINASNTLLENISSSPVEQSYKDEIEGEAYLVRAIAYFLGVRMWGDMPIITESPKKVEDAQKKRSSYIDVYKLILDDLDQAETKMRDYNRQMEVNGFKGRRPNKWAATALKVKVYSQIGSILSSPNDQPFKENPDFTRCGIANEAAAWNLALEAAESVITNGPYQLQSRFQDLFRWFKPEDWQSKEAILVLTNSNNTGGGWLSLRSLPNYYVYSEQTENGEVYGGRTTVNNPNYGRWMPTRYVFQKFAATYGGTLSTAASRTDNLVLYTDCPDPRFKASYIYGSYQSVAPTTGNTINTSMYPSDKFVNNSASAYAFGRGTAQPFFKKYRTPNYNTSSGDADFYLLRFADVYLMAAEAAASLSNGIGDANWQKAFNYIEVLHSRARNSVSPAALQPKWEANRFATKDELITAIFYERLFELGGEGHEWFDVRRRGANFFINNVNKPINYFLDNTPSETTKLTSTAKYTPKESLYYVPVGKNVFTESVADMLRSLLCAFPQNAILLNPAVTPEDQNKYYWE